MLDIDKMILSMNKIEELIEDGSVSNCVKNSIRKELDALTDELTEIPERFAYACFDDLEIKSEKFILIASDGERVFTVNSLDCDNESSTIAFTDLSNIFKLLGTEFDRCLDDVKESIEKEGENDNE